MKFHALKRASIANSFLPGRQRRRKLLRVMKLTAILILAACLHTSATGVSQQTITFSGKEVTLESVFTAIKKQTNYRFFFNTDVIHQAQKVTIEVKNASVEQVMSICLKDQPYTYTIKGRTIFIIKKPEEIKSSLQAVGSGDPITVTGKVTDDKGSPLAGANVKVRGTNNGVTTDNEGRFVLKNVADNAVLEISYVGLEMKTFTVRSAGFVNIALDQKLSMLDETVVIGYGQTTRRFATGNIASVKAADIEKQPVQNALLALQGRVPGVEVTQLTGMNGGGITVRIQGQNSIMSGLEPLVVIDGVPFPTQMFGNSFESVVKGGSPLNYINPADIESIDILKDADATAIYGSRAANGAILITTKKGKAGRTKLTVNGQQGWGKVTRKVDMMNTRQYLDMRYEAFKNDGRIPSSNPTASAPFLYAPDLTIWDTTRYTDWQKVLIGGTAKYTNIGASISGGTTGVQYLIGTTFNRQTTVFPGDFDDKRAGIHFNINGTSANQKLQISLSGSYFFDRNHITGSDRTELATLLEPNAPPLFNADGTLNWAPNAAGSSTWDNPLTYFQNTGFVSTNKNLVSNLSLSYGILPGLYFRSNIGYTNLQSDIYKPIRIEFFRPERRPTNQRSAGFGIRKMNSWIVEPQLHYSGRIGKGKIEALAGATLQENSNNLLSILGVGYTSDLLMKSLLTAPSMSLDGANDNNYKYSALFGRLNYTLDEKYIINLTGRRDGSSRFGDKSKVHNFGSIGLGWIFSEEKWIHQHLSFLSFGKLRVSYGTTGNDQIADYSYLSLYEVVYTPVAYQNTSSLGVSYAPSNPHLQWEETRKWQGGIELGFINDRIIINTTYARNRSSNQLINYVLPSFSGFDDMIQNFPATIQNTSWEFTFNTTNIKAKDFGWTSSINLTIPRNKILSFPNIEFTPYANADFGVVIGEPIGISKVYRHAGVDPAIGQYLVFDKDGNPTNNPNFLTDRNVIISGLSKYYGGFLNSISYKGFQLDFLFQFVRQKGAREQYYYNGVNTPGRFVSGASNQPLTVLDRWQKPGDNTEFARYSVNQIATFPKGSDVYYINDASYIRLKNLSLSWQVPKLWLRKSFRWISNQNARLFIHGQNLATITNFTGLDPETKGFNLPPLQIWTVGAHVEL